MSDTLDEKTVNQTLQEQFRTFQVLLHRIYGPKRRGFHQGNPYRGQGRVLLLLEMQESINQKDLAFLLDIRPQSLGELLSKMEASELIVRTASEEDKRVMVVSITDKGRETAQKLKDEKENKSVWLDCLSADDKVTLSKLFQKMIDSMNETVESDEFKDNEELTNDKCQGGGGGHHHPHPPFSHHPYSERQRYFGSWR